MLMLLPYEATGLLVCWKRFATLGSSCKGIATVLFTDPCTAPNATSTVPSNRAHMSGARLGGLLSTWYLTLPCLAFLLRAVRRQGIYFLKLNFLPHLFLHFRNAYPFWIITQTMAVSREIRLVGKNKFLPLVDAVVNIYIYSGSACSINSHCCKGPKVASCGSCSNQLVIKTKLSVLHTNMSIRRICHRYQSFSVKQLLLIKIR